MLRFDVQEHVLAISKSTNPQYLKRNLGLFDFELSKMMYEKLKTKIKNEWIKLAEYRVCLSNAIKGTLRKRLKKVS